ncbi:MAG TPA: response regulator [Verrucomicrobiae bacterium]|nr:response regulator [Verrucomicrobiae bacterium]
MKTKPDANRKRHILIVDDNEQLAQSYKELLEAGDYIVSTAPNGVVALKHVLNQEIDAVICDLKMPQLEGDKFYVTVERIKPDLLRRFIFITGESSSEKFQDFLRKVESPVFTKPVPFEKLMHTIESFWARGG